MNKLTSKQQEILDILQEECAEVIQAISKVRRFGMENNWEPLCKEMADVLCMVQLAKDHIPEIGEYDMEWPIKTKLQKLQVYSTIFEDDKPLQGNNH